MPISLGNPGYFRNITTIRTITKLMFFFGHFMANPKNTLNIPNSSPIFFTSAFCSDNTHVDSMYNIVAIATQ